MKQKEVPEMDDVEEIISKISEESPYKRRPTQKRTWMTVPEMGKLLGLKKTDRYWLVHKNVFELLLMKSIRNFWQKCWQIQRCGHCSIHWRRRWSNEFYIQMSIFIVNMENLSPSYGLKSPSFMDEMMEINSVTSLLSWFTWLIVEKIRCMKIKYLL